MISQGSRAIYARHSKRVNENTYVYCWHLAQQRLEVGGECFGSLACVAQSSLLCTVENESNVNYEHCS